MSDGDGEEVEGGTKAKRRKEEADKGEEETLIAVQRQQLSLNE